MWVLVDRLGLIILDSTISAVVLWPAVAVAMLGCRQPARRALIARAAMVGSLAFLPLIGLGLVPQYDIFAFIEDVGLFTHPLTRHHPRPANPSVAGGPPASRVARAPQVARPPIRPERVLTLLYLAGVAGGLGWLALGHMGLTVITRRARSSSPEALALLEALPYPEWRTRPGLRVSERIQGPVLVGLIRPLILIPPGLERSECRDQLRLSLLHELAHAELRDPDFSLLSNLAQAFWFFIPPLWWVASQMRLDQEFLADRRAATNYGPVRAYASSLLELAAPHDHHSRPVSGAATTAVVVPADGGELRLLQRFMMLLRCPFPLEPSPPVWWSWGLPWLALLVTLAVATVTVRYPEETSTDQPGKNAFVMSRLEIPPSPPNSQSRARIFELPIRLPRWFDLTVEVWGDSSGLIRTRIAGLAIKVDGNESPHKPAAWHRVRLRRDSTGTTLLVDGQRVSVDSPDSRLTPWLSFEPPARIATSFRALTLNW